MPKRLLLDNNYGNSSSLFPPVRSGLAMLLDSRRGLTTTSAAFAGAGTVTITAGAAAFTSAQDGAVAVNDTILVNGNTYTVTVRTDTNDFTVTPANSEGAGSAFTITKSAPRVNTWTDQSGNANNWTNATASQQPLTVANGLSFDGFDDRFSAVTAALALAQNVTGLTILCVKAVATLGVATGLLQLRIGTGATSRILLAKASNDKWNFQAVRLDTDVLVGLAAGVLMTTARDVSTHILDYTNTTCTRWINGTQDTTNAAFLTAGSTSNTASTAAFLGSQGGSGFFAGTIQAMLIYQRALTTNERVSVERWLGQQFKVVVA